MEARRQLIVQYPPKRQDAAGPITIFGLKLGAEGRLNVTVRANPKPSAEWTVGDQVLAAPRQSEDGQFTTLEPLLLGNGYYNITLILARITKEDVGRTYSLRVDNGLGREEFDVRISTMDKPADPPKRQEAGPITIFGLKLGAEGRLNVTVRANPKPSVEWTVGDQVLAAPRQSEDGQFTTLEPLLLGNGYYNITLVLARITKEDVGRTYSLRVDNGLGREEFDVRISTMDKPADAEKNESTKKSLVNIHYPKYPAQDSGRPMSLISIHLNLFFRRECELEIQAREEPQYEEVMSQ